MPDETNQPEMIPVRNHKMDRGQVASNPKVIVIRPYSTILSQMQAEYDLARLEAENEMLRKRLAEMPARALRLAA